MFVREEVEALLDLQRRSYALLRWVGEIVEAGTLPLGSLHGALDAAGAAVEWITRNQSTFPPDARPPEGRVEALAHLFASYLTTSFEVASSKRVSDGCDCGFCTYLVNAPTLKAQTPSRVDENIAKTLELDFLEELALESGLPLLRGEVRTLLERTPETARAVAMLTYVRELGRRSAFRGQGRPVLVLWRQLAWKEGRLDRRFALTAEKVLAAEELVSAELGRLGAEGSVAVRPPRTIKDLDGADLLELDEELAGADLSGKVLHRAALAGADLTGARLISTSFANADLRRAVLRDANLEGADFMGAHLEDADLTGGDLYWAICFTASFQRAILVRADLRGADLKKVDLRDADLRDANLGRDNLGGSTSLQGADLRGARLEGASLNGAEYDENTRFPEGFDPAQRGMLRARS